MAKYLFLLATLVLSAPAYAQTQTTIKGEILFIGEITQPSCETKPYQKSKGRYLNNSDLLLDACDLAVPKGNRVSQVKIKQFTPNSHNNKDVASYDKKNKYSNSQAKYAIYIAEYK